MNPFLQAAVWLGLVEWRDDYERSEPMTNDVLYIPADAVVEGQIHTTLPVVVAGVMKGSINVRGDGKVTVLPKATVSDGLVSADFVEIRGVAANVDIDADRLLLTETGKIEGQSRVRYGQLSKHLEAPVNGLLQKRKSIRDGSAHIARSNVDSLSSE